VIQPLTLQTADRNSAACEILHRFGTLWRVALPAYAETLGARACDQGSRGAVSSSVLRTKLSMNSTQGPAAFAAHRQVCLAGSANFGSGYTRKHDWRRRGRIHGKSRSLPGRPALGRRYARGRRRQNSMAGDTPYDRRRAGTGGDRHGRVAYLAIRSPSLRRLGLTDAALATDPSRLTHIVNGKDTRVYFHKFHTVQVGPVTVHDVALEVMPGDPPALAGGHHMLDVLIGQDLLRTRRVWFSYTTNRLYL
jgi:hypothetical protein